MNKVFVVLGKHTYKYEEHVDVKILCVASDCETAQKELYKCGTQILSHWGMGELKDGGESNIGYTRSNTWFYIKDLDNDECYQIKVIEKEVI